MALRSLSSHLPRLRRPDLPRFHPTTAASSDTPCTNAYATGNAPQAISIARDPQRLALARASLHELTLTRAGHKVRNAYSSP